jgi:DNA-binding MarR family transcriptional regulator
MVYQPLGIHGIFGFQEYYEQYINHPVYMSLFNTPTTYRIGLVHTKLNRLLKQRTTRLLEGTGVNPPEWALLGVLFDAKKHMRLNVLAEELGVEASFVTTMAKSLTKRALIILTTDPDDNRAKEISLTKEGRVFVEKTERQLRDAMRPAVGSLSIRNLLSYFSVLNTLVATIEVLEREAQNAPAKTNHS